MGILKCILIACSCLVWATHAFCVEVKDTIEYRAQVWVDKIDLERYGGEASFKKNLQQMFHNTNRFWNESPNKFNYYFRFVPADELCVYDIQGDKDRYGEFQRKAFGRLDLSKYDFVLFLALGAKNEGLSCGGGGASGQSVVMCYVREAHNIFTDALYPDQGTYSNLGHEYGHVRGATDLYQYMIAAEDNPVSHEKLTPPKCNMGTGYRVWSDYCSALFNYTAKMRPLDKDLSDKVFPRKLVIKVGKMGKPLSNCTVNFYGTRAGGKYNKRDVYPKAYRTYTTSKRGIIEITDLYKLYHPDMTDANIPPKEPQDLFPYSYWFSFLVEIIDEVGQKKYVWLPDVELQREHLETGNDTYTVNVTF